MTYLSICAIYLYDIHILLESTGFVVANRDNFKKGSVEMLLLHLLQIEDLYGYQLSQLIHKHSNGILKIPEGSMYPTLYRLLDKGYITDYKKQVGRRLTRVYYHLEPQGQEYLSELLEDYTKVTEGIQLLLSYRGDDGGTQK